MRCPRTALTAGDTDAEPDWSRIDMDEITTEVLATPHELMRAASGHPIVVGTADGQQVRLRIPTAEEFREAVERGRQWHADNGLTAPDPPSDEQVARVIRPLEI